jgi:hypothetical protein
MTLENLFQQVARQQFLVITEEGGVVHPGRCFLETRRTRLAIERFSSFAGTS